MPQPGGAALGRPTAERAIPPWRDIRVLRAASQVAIVLFVALIGLWLWNNLTSAMARTSLTFGLGFLSSTAGFEISESLIAYSATDTYGRAFVVGLLNTLLISILGIVLATVLGAIVGVARLSPNWIVNRLAAGYVELMRNTPLLVQLVLLYAVFLQLPAIAESISLGDAAFLSQRGLYLPRPLPTSASGAWLLAIVAAGAAAVVVRVVARRREDAGRPIAHPALLATGATLGILVTAAIVLGPPLAFETPIRERFNFRGGLVFSPEFTALLVGLVVYTAAFIAEIVRGGILAVRRGQFEAARALGLGEGEILRLIVLPQALRVIVPPLTSQYLNLVKNSSLAIAVGFPDLFQVSSTMANQTGQPVSVIVLVMATYLALSLVTSLLMNLYNRRVQVLER